MKLGRNALYIKRFSFNYSIYVICILVFAVASLALPIFRTPVNLWGLMTEMSSYGLAAVGLTFVLLCGELDISMAAIIALTTVLYALLYSHVGSAAAFLIVIAVGLIIGTINGVLRAYLKLDSFMITLSTMFIVRGTAHILSDSKPVFCDDAAIIGLSQLNIGFFPVTFIFLIICVVIVEFIFRYTQFGRNIFAVGAAKDVALAAGINVKKYKVSVFIINSFFAVLAGIAMMSRIQSGSPIIAEDAQLAIISMVVIGGTAMSGGIGGAVKTLSGIILMGLIFNIMSLFNIYVNIQQLIRGSILLAVIISDRYTANKRKKV